jgi:hypothetical protein
VSSSSVLKIARGGRHINEAAILTYLTPLTTHSPITTANLDVTV